MEIIKISKKDEVYIKSHTILESTRVNSGSSIGPFARVRPNTDIGKQVKIGNYVYHVQYINGIGELTEKTDLVSLVR